ncbi:MAG: dihydrofolate reductase family protein, partial [Clostridiales bacterium]|nr:dihydrofolate reductase family protein [Clostridiales bacterium]
DSVLLEGGGTLNESALRAGIVREVKAFVAPKLFGGGGKSPVEGAGVALPDQAWQLELVEVTQIGDDLLLDYRVKEDRGCLQD